MTSANATLPDDPQILKGVIADLIVRHEKQIAILIEEIRLLRAQRFGRKSEKIVDFGDIEQLLLFDELPTRPSRQRKKSRRPRLASLPIPGKSVAANRYPRTYPG